MPLASTDIKSYKSLNANSDGGAIDLTREILSGIDNNLFPDITAVEALAGGTRYRKFFRKNTHATDTWSDARSYIKAQPANATVSMGIGIDHADDNDGAQGNLVKSITNAKVVVVSDGADTRNVTIIGENTNGDLTTETVALNGTTEVQSANTYKAGRVYAAYVASLSASRTVSIKEGPGGTVRGTIGINKKISFLYLTGVDLDTLSDGFKHGNIGPAANFALWLKKVWAVGAAAGNGFSIQVMSEGA